jgi:hypothetical protein
VNVAVCSFAYPRKRSQRDLQDTRGQVTRMAAYN